MFKIPWKGNINPNPCPWQVPKKNTWGIVNLDEKMMDFPNPWRVTEEHLSLRAAADFGRALGLALALPAAGRAFALALGRRSTRLGAMALWEPKSKGQSSQVMIFLTFFRAK
jgi:hypothetical protein